MALGLAAVSIGLLVLSLKHLTSGISSTTGEHWVFALMLAVAVDAGFVLTKLSQVSVAGRPVAEAIRVPVRLTVGGLLLLSAFYNIRDYWGGQGAEGARWEAVVLGATIPALMFAFSQIAAKLWLFGGRRS